MNQYGRDQRDYIKFRESDSRDDGKTGRFKGPNRYGEDFPRHDSYQDDQYFSQYDPTYEDENGIKHPYEHGGRRNRWSDDLRSDASRESHFGKGPKGYVRSPKRIKDEACDILMKDFALDASDIEVDVKDNILYLRGTVSSRKDKKRAEYLLEDISGISDVQNLLSVKIPKTDGWVPGLGKVSQEGDDHGKI